MRRNKIELLSPAGDLERLKVTLLYGADAVFIGGQKYSLRANATNFSIEQIKEACDFAHNLGKKVHLTLNIVFHNEDMEGVFEYIKEVVEAGIDAFIVSDPFIIEHIKKNYNVEVHLSTQASTTNYKTVQYFKDEGIDRIVLARETGKKDIKEIIEKVDIDIEVFIHGAMCICYSGRCALSNYITNRDANRGGCSQICRFSFGIEEEEEFTMASKDINMAPHIKDLVEMNVASMKVEGRMRSLYYLATVIGTYRKIVDDIYNNELTKEKEQKYQETLAKVANRETTSQYFTNDASTEDQYFTGRQELSNQEYLALITGWDEENKCLIMVERNYFEPGDEVLIFTPNKEEYSYIVNEIYDEKMNRLEVARHPEQILKLPFTKKLPEYSMIRLVKKVKK